MCVRVHYKKNKYFESEIIYMTMEKEVMEIKLVESLQKGINFYSQIASEKKFNCYDLIINTKDLVDKQDTQNEISKKKHDIPKSVKDIFFIEFDRLDRNINKKPCLYFFEFEHGLGIQILEEYKKFVINNKERNFSGLKDNPDVETNILYVGKVKKGVGARLSTHFGYANSKTGGLQLRFWAKELEIILKIHLIVFEENLGDYINPLELELTKKLNPLIGKSK